MPALAASDVTVTITQQRKVNGSPTRRHNGVTVAFGDGSLTYPTGGVPMPAGGSFGMPNLVVESMSIDDQSAGLGYAYTYDETNNKLYMEYYDYNDTGDNEAIQVATSVAPAAITLKCTTIGY